MRHEKDFGQGISVYVYTYMALSHKMWKQGSRLNVIDLMFKALVNFYFGTFSF